MGSQMSVDHRITDASSVDVRPYEPADLDQVLALLRDALGAWPILEGVAEPPAPDRFFRWKHEQSPFGASHLLVAERAGEIVGARAFMPWQLSGGGDVIEAVRSADAATSPRLQRSGVFRLIRTAADEVLRAQAAISFGTPNRQSYGA